MLKPLLLPQLVEERRKIDGSSPDAFDMLPYNYFTTNSSASDITSPVTPTFSTRGHVRYSSSTSSLELPPQSQSQSQSQPQSQPQSQDSPASPLQHPVSIIASTTKAGKRQLPDVEEEPTEKDYDNTVRADHSGLYSCLCE